jgi:hypothetical protein
MIQLPEPLLCSLFPPIDSEIPEVLQDDPTEDVAKPSVQKLFLFIV